jgi:hypothetical protein
MSYDTSEPWLRESPANDGSAAVALDHFASILAQLHFNVPTLVKLAT